jgi:hypothetical protein
MAARLNPSNIASLVKRQFAAALASKDLVFAPSTVERISDGGLNVRFHSFATR